MANYFPADFAGADLNALLAGRKLMGRSVAPMGVASNWCAAHVGSGTPRIWQTWPRRGNTSKEPQWTVDDETTVASWAIPGTRGSSSLVARLWGGSAAGTGKAWLTSSAGSSAEVNLASGAGGPTGALALAVDPDGDVVELHVHGHGADAWVSSICARTPPETSPLGAGALPSGCVGVDADELAYYQTLATDQGRQLRGNAIALRAIPHVYWSWSGVADTSLGADGKVMRAVPHVAPVVVWPDTDVRGWSLTVRVRVAGLAGEASQLVVVATNLGTVRPRRRAVWDGEPILTIPADEPAAWYEGTIRLPGDSTLSQLPAGVTSCGLAVYPRPSATSDADWLAVTGISPEYQTSAQVLSISAWGV